MRYLILPGNSFRDSDDSIKTGGQHIELDDDVAQLHAHRVVADPEKAPAPDALVVVDSYTDVHQA
jgi:hypothetical protein